MPANPTERRVRSTELVRASEPLVLPGAYEALSARLVGDLEAQGLKLADVAAFAAFEVDSFGWDKISPADDTTPR